MNEGEFIDKFFIVNFFLWTLAGYVLAFITLIVFPGVALYHCYRITDRQNSSDMFSTNGMGSTLKGSIKSDAS